MIHINLLEEKRAARSGSVSVPSLPQENLLYFALQGAIIVVALLVVIGWGFRNKQTISELNSNIATEQAELQRLQDVLDLAKKLEEKRNLLRRKIEVISKLKRDQDVPVKMLDHLSRNLAEYLWLSNLQVKGRKLTMRGRAQHEHAFATFMRNLQNSDHYESITPVALREGRSGTYDWTLTVNFILPEEAAARDSQRRADSKKKKP